MAPRFTSFGYTKGLGSRVSRGQRGIQATGGTIIDDGAYRIHVFTASGSLVVSNAGPGVVDYLVVAGGGGGGGGIWQYAGGGGGGAGGFRTGTNYPITATTYSITVGGGGNGATPAGPGPVAPQRVGTVGNNSVFDTITSTGGGAGVGWEAFLPAQNGGSGGGGVNNGVPGGTGNSPPTSPPQGNPGGTGSVYTGNAASSCGGGGGAGSPGGNGTSPGVAGPGGSGSPITWLPVSYGTPGPAPGRYFAAGGGGGGNPGSPGGSGGGGNGGSGNTAGTTATTNTGSGGGGGGSPGVNPSATFGGNGGPGIVAIRYLL